MREDLPDLTVVTLRSEPFVIYREGRYRGFSIELWEEIARHLGVEYTIYGVNTIAKLLDDVRRGVADAAVAGIGITSQREKALDFSHPYYESGLQIMVIEGAGHKGEDYVVASKKMCGRAHRFFRRKFWGSQCGSRIR